MLPNETETLVPVAGRDVMTLVTCTPIDVNSHRLLVTGERTEVPEPALQYPMESDMPGFPWWAVILSITVVGTILYMWRSNRKTGHEKNADDLAVADEESVSLYA